MSMQHTNATVEEELAQLRARVAELEAALLRQGGADPVAATGGARGAGTRLDSAKAAPLAFDALRAADERFHACLDNMLDCFAMFSSVRDATGAIVDFRFDYVNQAGCRNNGMPADAHVGRTLLELMPEHRQVLFERYRQVVATGEPLMLECVEFEDRFGGERPVKRAFDIRAWKLGDGFAIAWRDITGPTEAQRALRQSEEQFRLACEAAAGIIYSIDLKTQAVTRSHRLKDMLGISPEEAEPTIAWWLERLHPEERAEVMETVEKALADPCLALANFEYRLRHRDGRYVHLWDRWRIVRNESGAAMRVVGTMIDITARKEAEEALRASEQRYRQLFDRNPDGVVALDPTGRFIMANPACEHICGYTVAELLGMTFVDMCTPDTLDRAVAYFQTNLLEHADTQLEMAIYHKHGRRVEIWVSSEPIVADGQVVAVHCNVKDITTRKRAEAALRESEERFRIMAQTVPSFLFEMDVEGANTWSSDRWGQFTGQTVNEARGNGWMAKVHPEDLVANRAVWTQALRDGVPFEVRNRLLRHDGQWVWCIVRGAPVRNAEGKVYRWIGAANDVDELSRKEHALRESEERLQLTLEAAGLGMWESDLAGGEIHMTATNRRIFDLGEGSGPVPGMEFFKLIHPDDIPRLTAEFTAAARGERAYEAEYRVRRADGSWRWIQSNGRLMIGQGGRPQFVGVSRDVTTRKNMESALRESEGRLRLFVEHAPAALAMFDTEMRYLCASRRWMTDFGLTGDILGRYHYEVLPEIPERWKEIHRRALAGEVLQADKDAFHRADGSVQWLRWEVRPWYDAHHEVAGIMVFSEDVTHSQQAEDALRESEARLSAALQGGRMGLWDWDLTTNQSVWNDIEYELLGMPVGSGQAPTSAYMDRVHPDDAGGLRDVLATVMAGGTHFYHEHRVRTGEEGGGGGGADRWLAAAGRLHRDAAGRPVRMIGVNYDITDRKHAEAALREAITDAQRARADAVRANKAKDKFLAVLSHELRTPLTPILVSVAMLLQDPRLDGGTRENLEIVRRNVELETRLIDDLLDVARIEKGKLELTKGPVELAAVIEQAVEVCMPDFLARGVDLDVDAPDEPLILHADETRLQQVFWNLLRNAAKFTPAKGRVTLRIRHDGGQGVVVEVTDTGEGIDSDLLPRIFDAFQQGEGHASREFGGLGLGLAISQAIVRLHGGTLMAGSAGKGQGATFTVSLPLLAKAAPAVDKPSRGAPAAAAECRKGVQILLVEDHADTAKVMQRLLTAAGHVVTHAGSVAAALALVDAESFDLLLSDLGLPDGSGLDLLRAIRGKGLKLPAIALSGYGHQQDLARSAAAGFAVHLVKPVNPVKLEETLKSVLQSRGPA
jgi:PAS domain S-box-containing protein